MNSLRLSSSSVHGNQRSQYAAWGVRACHKQLRCRDQEATEFRTALTLGVAARSSSCGRGEATQWGIATLYPKWGNLCRRIHIEMLTTISNSSKATEWADGNIFKGPASCLCSPTKVLSFHEGRYSSEKLTKIGKPLPRNQKAYMQKFCTLFQGSLGPIRDPLRALVLDGTPEEGHCCWCLLPRPHGPRNEGKRRGNKS